MEIGLHVQRARAPPYMYLSNTHKLFTCSCCVTPPRHRQRSRPAKPETMKVQLQSLFYPCDDRANSTDFETREGRSAKAGTLRANSSTLSKGSEGFIKQHMYVVNVHNMESIKGIQFPLDLRVSKHTIQTVSNVTETVLTLPWLL